MDRYPTGVMIHRAETGIAEASRCCSLRPGDVIRVT